jgi:hypothetical protein
VELGGPPLNGGQNGPALLILPGWRGIGALDGVFTHPGRRSWLYGAGNEIVAGLYWEPSEKRPYLAIGGVMKIWIVIALCFCTSVAYAQSASPVSGPASTTGDQSPAVTGNNNTVNNSPAPAVRPSDEFLADVDTYIRLVADVQEMLKKLKATKEWKAYQDTTDRALGMQLRITQQIPRGYTFDQKSRLLVPVAQAAGVTPVPVPPAANPAPVKP